MAEVAAVSHLELHAVIVRETVMRTEEQLQILNDLLHRPQPDNNL
jgi:hypothetical protein